MELPRGSAYISSLLMKYLVWLISGVNVYFGIRCFLNAVHVLHTSKYSQATTVIFALLFLALGGAGFYFSLARGDNKVGLWISFGPWVLGLVILFISMVTSKYP